jgi:hypothetical protein
MPISYCPDYLVGDQHQSVGYNFKPEWPMLCPGTTAFGATAQNKSNTQRLTLT